MIIPDSVWGTIVKKPTDNNYIYGAEMLYKRLKDVETGKVDYIPYDMATAANCLEMYYKGFIEASGKSIEDLDLNTSHYLPSIYAATKDIINLNPKITDNATKRELNNFLRDLSKEYINTRYNNSFPLESEFKKVMGYISHQREIILSTLDPTRAWETENDKKKEPLKEIPDWMKEDLER